MALLMGVIMVVVVVGLVSETVVLLLKRPIKVNKNDWAGNK